MPPVCTPPNTRFLGSIQVYNPNGILIGSSVLHSLRQSLVWHTRVCIFPPKSIASAVFAQLTAERPYKPTLQWAALSPLKLPLTIGDQDPDLTRDSVGPSKPTTQTASRSVEPFWATVCKTVRPMLSDRCLSCLSFPWPWYMVTKRLDGSRCHLVST